MNGENRRYDPISYQGPSQEYKAGFVANTPTESNFTDASGELGVGIHDIAHVRSLFAQMQESLVSLVSDLETVLRSYSLTISPEDETLYSAYLSAFTAEQIAKSSGFIHFYMYKYLLKDTSNNAKNYVRRRYESQIRGMYGTNALDVLKLAVLINSEMTRMKEFLDGFIGEVDDTSEFRIIEAFQSWAEDAVDTITKLRETLENKKTAELTRSDLESLDKSKASGIQALFKIKLNVLNKSLVALFAEVEREYDVSADTFYQRFLGPSLRFRIKISKDLANGITSPVLSREIQNTVSSLDSTFAVQLADLFKRGMNFQKRSLDILSNMAVRDTYAIYMRQLSSIGTVPGNPFTNATILEEELATLDSVDLLKDFRQVIVYDDNFTKSHFELADTDDDEAHPQYLLRSGGNITGDITLEDNVKIGGIVPAQHKHNGVDGSAKISGADIEYNSVSANVINTDTSDTAIPYDLLIVGQSSEISPIGASTITLQLGFKIEDENAAGYEFEITKLG